DSAGPAAEARPVCFISSSTPQVQLAFGASRSYPCPSVSIRGFRLKPYGREKRNHADGTPALPGRIHVDRVDGGHAANRDLKRDDFAGDEGNVWGCFAAVIGP